MTAESTPPKGPPADRDRKAEREAKLAQALRANLRRRKIEPKPKAAAPRDGEST